MYSAYPQPHAQGAVGSGEDRDSVIFTVAGIERGQHIGADLVIQQGGIGRQGLINVQHRLELFDVEGQPAQRDLQPDIATRQ